MNLENLMLTLRQERQARGITPEELGKRAGLDDSTLKSLESGERKATMRLIQRYSEGLGFKLSYQVRASQVLAFFNHAGGVGKSSAVRDVGFALSQLGFKVLLIDADPQANLTSWLGVKQAIAREQTLFPAAIGEPSTLALPSPLEVHGLHLIPSSLELARLEPQLVGAIMGITRLRNAIRKLSGYDFVLIDPPPSLGQLSAMAVVASDGVVVPVPTNVKGLEGVRTVLEMVQVYREASPELRLVLFLLTQFDERTRHDRDSVEFLREQLSSLAPVSTPLAVRPAVYKDASMSGQPIAVFGKDKKAIEEILSVTAELLQALEVSVDVQDRP